MLGDMFRFGVRVLLYILAFYVALFVAFVVLLVLVHRSGKKDEQLTLDRLRRKWRAALAA